MESRQRTARLGVALLALGIPATATATSAQGPIHNWVDGPIENEFEWPASLGGGIDFRATTAGTFTGDSVVSVAVLSGNQIVILWAPHVAKGFIEVSGPATPVTALATLPGGVGPGHDSLLAVGPAGLVEFAFDPLNQQFAEVGPIGDATWVGARAVFVEDVDEDGHADVLGISGDGLQVLVMMGGPAGFLPTIEIAVPTTARRVCVLDYDGDVADAVPGEICVLCQGGLHLFTDQGAGWVLQQDFPTAISGGDVAVVRNTDGLDRLAWITRLASGAWRLAHFRDDDVAALVQLSIPPDTGQPGADFDLVGLVAGDRDGDGDDDLVIATTSLQRLFSLQNLDGAFDVSEEGEDYEYVDLSDTPLAAGPTNECRPTLADHGSGFASIVMPVESSGHIVSVTGLSPEQEDLKEFAGVNDLHVVTAKSSDGVTTTIWIALEGLPPAWLAMDGIEYVLWHQSGPGADLDATAVAHEFHARPDPLPGNCDRLYLTLTFSEAEVDWPQHYWLQLRFVDVEQGHVVASRGDSILGLAAEDPTSGDFAYLTGRPGAGEPSWMPFCPYPPGMECVGGGEVGAVVPQNDLPPFPPTLQPEPLPLDTQPSVDAEWCYE